MPNAASPANSQLDDGASYTTRGWMYIFYITNKLSWGNRTDAHYKFILQIENIKQG